MKPLHLSLQGFTAFRQPTQLDFSDLELFALVGPTGSGKSSLLDAMTFALYGETARLGSIGLDALIAQGERGLSVSLVFEAGGDTYRASRTRGRRQAENEVRLDRLDRDGEWTGLNSGSQKDIGKRIEEAVGLDFDTFTRCVMLPQGQFAALLHGKARQRQELLGELMGLSHVQQMQAVSADRVKEFKHQSASLGSVLLSEYAGVSPEAAAELRRAREATDAETERLVQTREHLQAQLLRLREQEKVWRSREETARRLQLLGAVPLPRDHAELAGAAPARRAGAALHLLEQAEAALVAPRVLDGDEKVSGLARGEVREDLVLRASCARARGAVRRGGGAALADRSSALGVLGCGKRVRFCNVLLALERIHAGPCLYVKQNFCRRVLMATLLQHFALTCQILRKR